MLSAASVLSDDVQPMAATLHYLAVHGGALSPAQVKQNFDAKLPNSPPVAFGANATVAEDGEAVCGSMLSTPNK